MKNKKGFTLIELLATIVILGIITGIGYFGVNGILDKVHENMLKTKKKSIVEAADFYAQDNEIECKSDGEIVLVSELINKGYLTTEEVNKDGDKVIINDVTGKPIDYTVNIICKNNRYYAEINEGN